MEVLVILGASFHPDLCHAYSSDHQNGLSSLTVIWNEICCASCVLCWSPYDSCFSACSCLCPYPCPYSFPCLCCGVSLCWNACVTVSCRHPSSHRRLAAPTARTWNTIFIQNLVSVATQDKTMLSHACEDEPLISHDCR